MQGRLKLPFPRVKPFTRRWDMVTNLNWFDAPFTYRRIKVARLIGTQASVRCSGLLTKNDAPIYVVRIAGKNYIRDGHHRATRAFLRGQKTIQAFVLNLNDKGEKI